IVLAANPSRAIVIAPVRNYTFGFKASVPEIPINNESALLCKPAINRRTCRFPGVSVNDESAVRVYNAERDQTVESVSTGEMHCGISIIEIDIEARRMLREGSYGCNSETDKQHHSV